MVHNAITLMQFPAAFPYCQTIRHGKDISALMNDMQDKKNAYKEFTISENPISLPYIHCVGYYNGIVTYDEVKEKYSASNPCLTMALPHSSPIFTIQAFRQMCTMLRIPKDYIITSIRWTTALECIRDSMISGYLKFLISKCEGTDSNIEFAICTTSPTYGRVYNYDFISEVINLEKIDEDLSLRVNRNCASLLKSISLHDLTIDDLKVSTHRTKLYFNSEDGTTSMGMFNMDIISIADDINTWNIPYIHRLNRRRHTINALRDLPAFIACSQIDELISPRDACIKVLQAAKKIAELIAQDKDSFATITTDQKSSNMMNSQANVHIIDCLANASGKQALILAARILSNMNKIDVMAEHIFTGEEINEVVTISRIIDRLNK